MAVDNGISINKQLPQFPDGSTSGLNSHYADQWSMENVVKWLEAHGWGSVAPRFESHNIQGQSFLDLSMSKLTEVFPRSELAYKEKRRLLHGIHSIQVSHSQQSPPLINVQYDENTIPSHYLDTSRNNNDTKNFKTSPISTTSTSSYSSALFTPNAFTPKSPPNPQFQEQQKKHDSASANIAPSLESEYARIRPFIPERKSSNPEQISKIMKQFNVPPSLPLARARPNPIISRRSSRATNFQYSSINGTRQASNDGKDTWKISRRPVFTKPIQELPQAQIVKEQRIQVTVDSDTFFSLTVTNINDSTTLKASIVKKVGMQPNSLDEFQFFHENGDNSDLPLDDDELLYICSHSDNLKHRILVRAAHSNNTENYIDQTTLYTQEPASLWAVPPNPINTSNSSPTSPLHYNNQDNIPSASLWAVPPRSLTDTNSHSINQQTVAQLWAVPPRPTENKSKGVNNTTNSSITPISAPLWAVPPRSTDGSNDSINNKNTPISTPITASLWAVPPQPTNYSDNNQNNIENDYNNSSNDNISFSVEPSPSAALWAVPPQPIYNSSPTYTKTPIPASLWVVPPQPIETNLKTVSDNSQSSSALWAIPPKQIQSSPISSQPTKESAALWAIPPKNTEERCTNDNISAGLWAVPPKISPSNSSSTTIATNTIKQSSISTPPPSSSLWDDPTQLNSHYQQSYQNSITINNINNKNSYIGGGNPLNSDTLHTNLKAVKLEDPPVNLNLPSPTLSTSTLNSSPSLKPTLATSASTGTKNPKQRLQIQIPSEQQLETSEQPKSPQYTSSNSSSPITTIQTSTILSTANNTPSLRTPQSSENDSPIISSQDLTDVEDNNWAERPSIEKLYRDIDKYLPGHDLDKEITLETETNGSTPSTNISATAPLTRKLQGHKKSVRVVAKEAHRNWRQAVNVIRVNNILRRKSTKMWGHKVQQVKPGMIIANDKDIQTMLPNGKPAPTKLQWMRGQLIGKGSYGRVYHALNVAAGEWIAVKQVDIPTTTSDHHNKQLHETADALYREISLLKDLEHENIVQYLGYDVDEEEGYINIFLEYVPGGSIQSCLSKQGKFDESLVSFLTRQILLGLEYLHDRNILHRDIKAGNVLITHTGTCKITDFGLSKLSGQDKAYDAHANNSVMRGTVFWMAPEVVSGTNYNAKVDIWSLGCTVIEMLTGKHPWLDMNMFAALYSLGRFEAPPIPEGITENAKDFLELCFKINPEERPTAADLLVHSFVGQNPSFKFKEHMKS